MARIRTIKPEFFTHRELAGCTPHARLLAIGLLTMADCEGRMELIPMQVHAGVFPWEASVCVSELLQELQRVGYVQKYTDSGRDYLQIVNFVKHQRITGKEAQQRSKLPEPKEISPIDEGEAPGCFPEKYLDAQGTGEQGNRGTGEEKKGARRQKRPSAPQTAVDVPDWIDGDAWAGFAEMRKASRFPLTKRAAESIIAKLDDYRRQGQDPADVLDQSTRSGWRDVYPLKKDRVNGHGGETLEERIRRVSEDFAQGAPDA